MSLIDVRLINPYLYTGCRCVVCQEKDDFGAYAILHVMRCESWEKCPHTWCSKKMADTICHAAFCEKGNACSAHCRRLNVIFENVFHPKYLLLSKNQLLTGRLLFFRMLVIIGRKHNRYKKINSTGAKFLRMLLNEPFASIPTINKLFRIK